MTDWAELVSESKSEWGIKALLAIGVWIIAPVFGGLEYQFNLIFVLLVLMFIGMVFGNLAWDDFISSKDTNN